MEAAILLARALDDIAATPLIAPPAHVEPDTAQEQESCTTAVRWTTTLPLFLLRRP
jgi:hypothetical protein